MPARAAARWQAVAGPMPEAVRNHINVSADGIVPAFHGVGVPAPASFRAQSRKRFGAGHRPVKHAAKTGLVEDLHADAPGRNDAIDCAGARVVARFAGQFFVCAASYTTLAAFAVAASLGTRCAPYPPTVCAAGPQ